MLNKLSLKHKLFIGFGFMISVIVGISLLTVVGINTVKDGLTEFRTAARNSLKINKTTNIFTDTRLNLMTYRATGDLIKANNAKANATNTLGAVKDLKKVLAGTELEAPVDKLITDTEHYTDLTGQYISNHESLLKFAKTFSEDATGIRDDLSRLVDTAHSSGDLEAAFMAAKALDGLAAGQLYTERYVASSALTDLDLARGKFRDGLSSVKDLIGLVKVAAVTEQAKGLEPRVSKISKDIEALGAFTASRDAIRIEMDELGPGLMTGYQELLAKIVERQNTIGPAAQTVAENTVMQAIVVSAVFTLLGALIAVMLAMGLSRSINLLTLSMRRLADGDLDAAIFGTGRRDEIGTMASAVEVFKANAIERRKLEQEQDALKTAAEVEKREAMTRLAGEFENAVGGIVSNLSTSAGRLKLSAETMAQTSGETSRQSAAVAATSEQASANVQTVASASEELSASVEDIGRQVSMSARMSDEAVAEARETVQRVNNLSEAAERIGDIIGLIQDIAGQTNLLALNATIEAARAGEAGRGFAVVASEVKNLAAQTARATTDIATQIGAIQSTTAETASSIDGISNKIRDLSAIATSIAGAVEEQGATTREIARNVQEAAQGTSEVSHSIAEVQQAAVSTTHASGDVLSAADALADEAVRLQTELDNFLANVRAA